MLTATVDHPLSRKRKRIDFYVAATHDSAILGMKACRGMDLLFVNEINICTVQNDRSTASNTDVDVVAAEDDITSTATERKRNSKRRARGAATPPLNRPPPDASRFTAVAAAVGQPLTKEVVVKR